MSQMGLTSQENNCDRFICETSKGVVSVGNVQDIDRAPVEPFIGHSGWISERLENMRQPLSLVHEIWRFVPYLHVGTGVHLCRVLKA